MATNRVRTILDNNYENTDSNKTINENCQHLTVTKQGQLLSLLTKYGSLFGVNIGTWDTHLVSFELKEGAKPVCSRAYPVPKSQEIVLNIKKRLSVFREHRSSQRS